MRQFRRDQTIEAGDELMDEFGREIDGEQFDGDGPIVFGIVARNTGPNVPAPI